MLTGNRESRRNRQAVPRLESLEDRVALQASGFSFGSLFDLISQFETWLLVNTGQGSQGSQSGSSGGSQSSGSGSNLGISGGGSQSTGSGSNLGGSQISGLLSQGSGQGSSSSGNNQNPVAPPAKSPGKGGKHKHPKHPKNTGGTPAPTPPPVPAPAPAPVKIVSLGIPTSGSVGSTPPATVPATTPSSSPAPTPSPTAVVSGVVSVVSPPVAQSIPLGIPTSLYAGNSGSSDKGPTPTQTVQAVPKVPTTGAEPVMVAQGPSIKLTVPPGSADVGGNNAGLAQVTGPKAAAPSGGSELAAGAHNDATPLEDHRNAALLASGGSTGEAPVNEPAHEAVRRAEARDAAARDAEQAVATAEAVVARDLVFQALPQGAAQLLDHLPIDAQAVDRALVQFMHRIEGLGDELGQAPRGVSLLGWVVLGAVATKAVRSARRRLRKKRASLKALGLSDDSLSWMTDLDSTRSGAVV